ncbi:MAG: multiple sugar transport system permease protein [Thermomicrobiales bacterium]|jgi:multiple sugar transport system permease protein|nr:multiple sugar transport system permease protein [Thermomicrobiales bacterium]MEA2585547.1 multiple sugar transport system permease protein [Thermomicrobiales bacterium]
MALSQAMPRVRQRTRFRLGANRDWPWALFFLAPNLILFLVFFAYPIVYGLYISLFDWKIIGPKKWVGIGNYVDFFGDDLTRKLLWNSIYYVVGSTVPLILLSLGIATLLNTVVYGKYAWRGLYFLPLVSSPVAAAAVWKWLYAKDQGLINYAFVQLGGDRIDWLYNTRWALPSLILMTIWQLLPFNTIVYLAGLQEVPRSLYDAAEVDGATGWRKFRDITIPLVTPTTFFVIMITLFSLLFGSFDIINVMTQGGPIDSTNVFVYNIYQNAFKFFRMGYASAEAYLLFLVVFVLTLGNWALQKRWVHYE